MSGGGGLSCFGDGLFAEFYWGFVEFGEARVARMNGFSGEWSRGLLVAIQVCSISRMRWDSGDAGSWRKG